MIVLYYQIYIGIHSKLRFRCKCGNEFEVSFSNFKYGNKRKCNECSIFKLDKKICPICLNEFRPRNKSTKFCSHKCKCKSQENKIYYKCDYCGKETFTKPNVYNKSKKHYCSRKCSDLAQIKKVKIKCDYCGNTLEKIESDLSRYNKHFCNNECSGKYKLSPFISDEERERKRFRKADKVWSRSIKEKFNGKCVICNKSKSKTIKIVSHHLDGWNLDVSKRVDIENGVCLCENCHKEFHSIYGYGLNTKQQFEEFYSMKIPRKAKISLASVERRN